MLGRDAKPKKYIRVITCTGDKRIKNRINKADNQNNS